MQQREPGVSDVISWTTCIISLVSSLLALPSPWYYNADVREVIKHFGPWIRCNITYSCSITGAVFTNDPGSSEYFVTSRVTTVLALLFAVVWLVMLAIDSCGKRRYTTNCVKYGTLCAFVSAILCFIGMTTWLLMMVTFPAVTLQWTFAWVPLQFLVSVIGGTTGVWMWVIASAKVEPVIKQAKVEPVTKQTKVNSFTYITRTARINRGDQKYSTKSIQTDFK